MGEGYYNETLKAYRKGDKYEIIQPPQDLGIHWKDISNTNINEIEKILELDGYYNNGTDSFWLEWSVNYSSLILSWDAYKKYQDKIN